MTVIRWIKDGKLPAFKTAGGHRRILRADLDRFCTTRGIPFFPDGEGAQRRVLIVDADPTTRDAIAQSARAVDGTLVIESASDAFTGGRLLASFRPNLLFLDQRLPGVDSLELTSRLARDPETQPVAIVVLAATASADAERAFRARGAIACVGKPPGSSAIEKLVRTAFRMPEETNGPPPYVMILDGDARHAKTVRQDLETAVPGVRVAMAESSIDLLLGVGLDRPDLILLDLARIEVDSGEMVRRIVGRLPDSPIHVVVMGDSEAAGARAIEAGAAGFLKKPVDAAEIVGQLGKKPKKKKK